MMLSGKIKQFFKDHYLALVIAILAGFISVGPEMAAIFNLGANYQGIPFFGIQDNLYYTAKIQDILDGHWTVSSPFLFEYKNAYPLVLPIGEFFYAVLASLFFLSVANTLLLAKFLFPAILFFLIYLLILKIIKQNILSWSGKINSIMGGLLVVLGYDFADYKSTWFFVSGQMHQLFLSVWARPVNPVTGAMLLFVFLLLLWRMINRQAVRPKFAFLPAGLILGSMVYYFFSWGTAMSVLGVLMIIYFIKKEREIVKQLFWTVLVNFLIILPYWCGLWLAIGGENWQRVSRQNGMFYTHGPLGNKVLLASLLIFLPCLIYEFHKKRRTGQKLENWWWFGLAFLLGGLLALNQQILTGRAIWPYHFVQYTIPLSMITLSVWFYNFIRPKWPKLWRVGTAAIFIFLAVFVFMLIRSFSSGVGDMGKMQKYSGVLAWLNGRALIDSVVLVKEPENPLATLIPTLTSSNVYWTNWLPLSLIPAERIYHNYLVLLRINNIKPEAALAYMQKHQQEFRDSFAVDWDMLLTTGDSEYLNKRMEQVAADYQEFYKKDFLTELKKYRLDYILSVGPLEENIKKQLPGLKLENQFKEIDEFLYKF